VHRPKITAVGLVNLYAYARPNVNYEVSAQMGQFYVAVYSGGRGQGIPPTAFLYADHVGDRHACVRYEEINGEQQRR